MKPDIQKLEELNHLFLQLVSHIFLTPSSSQAFNQLTGAQKKVLYLVSCRGPQRMSEIARYVGVTMAAATSVVDRLVKSEMATRAQDPGDRRVVQIDLTAAGRRAVKQINRMHEKSFEQTLAHLNASERRELIAAFKKIHYLLTYIHEAQNKSKARKGLKN